MVPAIVRAEADRLPRQQHEEAMAILQQDPVKQLWDTSIGAAPGRGRLEGRRILVIGAGQRATPEPSTTIGNGRAMSMLFAREGAAVACADMDLASAEETAAMIAADSGGKTAVIQADVSKAAEIKAMFDSAKAGLGGLDGVVCNVGISIGRKIHDETQETWNHVVNVNLTSHMLSAQRALEDMDAGGAIVFISSGASVSPLGGNPAYEASKAALSALARSVAKAGQERGVRANVLAPGLLDTPMGRAATARNPARGTRPVPFGRQGTGWEMAYAVLFLISHEASYVNAQTILLDGGANSNIVSLADWDRQGS